MSKVLDRYTPIENKLHQSINIKHLHKVIPHYSKDICSTEGFPLLCQDFADYYFIESEDAMKYLGCDINQKLLKCSLTFLMKKMPCKFTVIPLILIEAWQDAISISLEGLKERTIS